MPRHFYEHYGFRGANLQKVETANEIIEKYMDAGYTLTLRQLYYQFVANYGLPNKVKEYKNLSGILTKSRLTGMTDWEGIEDRTRTYKENSHWNTPQDIVRACAEQFRLDTRIDQDLYVEVWIEKDALVGVIEDVCRELDVGFFSCRGYVSASAMWKAGQRLKARWNDYGQKTVVLHLGDHDPSGMQMTEDMQRRLSLFGADVEVKRIALNMDQVRTYNPPPNPAKMTDPRAADYIAEYGNDSWELDALEPDVIVQLIRDEVALLTDINRQAAIITKQQKDRDQLNHIAENWSNFV